MRDNFTGKAVTVTRQIVPNGPIETFSNKPMRVNGVRIQPTWPWSDQYRKVVRAEMAKVKIDVWPQALKYQNWYKAKFGKAYDGEGRIFA